jgi:Protein of unknown function (DUF3052)
VSATAGQAQDERGQAERLGIKPGQVVQEIGYDEDADEQLREAIIQVDGVELVDEDYDDVVDVVLLWWRDGDGDLVDALVDALTPLADGGNIWLLTPKAGRSGHVEPSDIGEAAPTAGLSQTSSVSAARDWSGTRLVAPKARRLGRAADARVGVDLTVRSSYLYAERTIARCPRSKWQTWVATGDSSLAACGGGLSIQRKDQAWRWR